MDKLILVFYIYVGGLDEEQIGKLVDNLKSNLGDWEKENIIQYWVPVTRGDTKIECLNPKIVSKEEVAHILETLQNLEERVREVQQKSLN